MLRLRSQSSKEEIGVKEYIKPVIEIIEFSTENIVTISAVGSGGLLEDIAAGQDGMATSVISYNQIFETSD